MRITTLLPCALLPLLASTAPPPAAYPRQPLLASFPKPPRWRSLSERFIGSLWGIGKAETKKAAEHTHSKVLQPPAHTLTRYGGDVVLRFNISSADEAASLSEAADVLLLDVWEFAEDWVDIRLAKDIVPSLLGLLPASLQRSHTPLLRERDLAQAIYDTYPTPRTPDQAHNAQSVHHRPYSPNLHPASEGETNIFFHDYQPLSVIEPWLRLLASLFTTHVRLINIGITYQGRDIPALRVGVHPTNNEDPEPQRRKTVLVTGGIHAREWIGTSTVNYIAYSFITGYGKVPFITALLENFDFVFVPTMNPDGYVYTWETDRLWRKNRQQTGVRFCQGIDLDRSFGFEWDGSTTSGNPCSESFAGEGAFEAVEAKRLSDWARNETENNNVEFVGFLDLHSYSQQILYPYSYSCDASPPSLENLEELAMGLAKVVRVSHGHIYQVSPACEGNVALTKSGKKAFRPRMEESGGSALDWFYHSLRVRYTYQIKLRDRGSYGFLLPKENIVPTGKEMLDAVLYFGRYISGDYGVLESEDDEPMPKAELPVEPIGPVEEIKVKSVVGSSSRAKEDDAWEWEDVAMDDVEWELRRRRRR